MTATGHHRDSWVPNRTRGRALNADVGLNAEVTAPSAADLARGVTDQLRVYLSDRRAGATYIGTEYDGLIAASRTSSSAAANGCARLSPTGATGR